MSVKKISLLAGDNTNYPHDKDRVTVTYTAWLANAVTGRKDKRFDTKRDFVLRLGIGVLIEGWEIALQSMSLGEKSLFTIPPQLAYKGSGLPGIVPPDTALILEIELRAINERNV